MEATQETGDTALSLSSYFGRPSAVAELVRRGAKVDCRDLEGSAPGEVFEEEVDPATQRHIQVQTIRRLFVRRIFLCFACWRTLVVPKRLLSITNAHCCCVTLEGHGPAQPAMPQKPRFGLVIPHSRGDSSPG